MKQLVPTSLDEYLEEHKVGDAVSGRVLEVDAGEATVELGEGIRVACRLKETAETASAGRADLSALTSLLQAKWKGGAGVPAKAEPMRAGQVRSFRIMELDREAKRIWVEVA